jgi:hypothetical protein
MHPPPSGRGQRDGSGLARSTDCIAHWHSPDPLRFTGTPEQVRHCFFEVAAQIAHRIDLFCSLGRITCRRQLYLGRALRVVAHRAVKAKSLPIHFQLIWDCRHHSHRVPMRRICKHGTNRDISGDRRGVRLSDDTTPSVNLFFGNNRDAER